MIKNLPLNEYIDEMHSLHQAIQVTIGFEECDQQATYQENPKHTQKNKQTKLNYKNINSSRTTVNSIHLIKLLNKNN